jgi:hypothetical protein
MTDVAVSRAEQAELYDLVQTEMDRVFAKMKAPTRKIPPIVIGGIDCTPSHERLHELRWQKLEVLAALRAKLSA